MQLKKHIYLIAIAALCIILAGGIIGAIMLRSSLLGDSWQVPVSTEKTLDEISEAKAKPSGKGMTTILLEGNSASIEGEGAGFYGGVLTIREGGNYEISGSLENGQIVVNTKGREAVTLYLNGVKVFHPYEAALEVKSDGHTLLVMNRETVSRLQSGAEQPIVPIGEGAGSGAAISSRGGLFLAGEGALQVLGYVNDGLQAGGTLAIESGKIDVVAVNAAMKGGEAVVIEKGEFSLKSGGDGIRAGGAPGEESGVVSISDGSFIIKSCGDGIQADALLEVRGGVLTVDAGVGLEESWQRDADAPPSAKGLRSGGSLRLDDCSVSVQSPDNALHAGGQLHFISGSCTLHSKNTALYAGEGLDIFEGMLHIAESHVGLEGAPVGIHGGELFIASASQGIHAAARGSGEKAHDLVIEGGRIELTAGQTALCAEGSLYLRRGTVLIDGPEDPDIRALQAGGACKVGSAVLLIADGAGIRDTSCFSHNYILRRFSTPLQAGDSIRLTTRNGSILIEHSLKGSTSSLIFSSPELYSWRSYLLSAGGLQSEPEVRRGSGAAWLQWLDRLKWWEW